jgi:hypothetical protein
MMFRPGGTELFHANQRKNMTKLIVAFRNFGKAPKMSVHWNTLLCFQFFCHTVFKHV